MTKLGTWLDFKLGARMFVKYPGLTIVGVLAMAIGIGLGAAYLEVVNDFLHPTLPFDEGERIVGLQNWDLEEHDPELRSMHDFVVWREGLESVQDLGAFRSIERNVGVTNGAAEPVGLLDLACRKHCVLTRDGGLAAAISSGGGAVVNYNYIRFEKV